MKREERRAMKGKEDRKEKERERERKKGGREGGKGRVGREREGEGKKGKGNLHPLLDTGGNAASKDPDQAEVLSAFFASVFPSEAGCSLGTQPFVLVDGDGEQNRHNPR